MREDAMNWNREKSPAGHSAGQGQQGQQGQWITPYFRAYSGRFALYLILGTLTILAASMLMFTSGFLISKSSLQPYNILLVYVPIVGIRAFGIGRAVIHYVERLVGHDAVLRILSKMRVRLYNILEPQALFIRSRYRAGDILGVLADDIEQLQNVYIRTVFPSLVAVIIYGIAVIALGQFDWLFALLVAGYIFILVAVLPYISLMLTRRTNAEVKRERNGLYQKLTDAVMGIGDWVVSGRPAEFLESYEHDEDVVARKERKLRAWARWRSLIGQLVVGIAVLSMIYWSGGQAAAGQIDPVLIAAFVLVVFPLADAFLPLSEAIERTPQYQESLRRLDRITQPALVRSMDTVVDGTHAELALHQQRVAAVLAAAQAMDVHLELQGVSFAYEAERNTQKEREQKVAQTAERAKENGREQKNHNQKVAQTAAEGILYSVRDVSLNLPQGKRVMVIGRSGAGKSTLLKLIQGAISPVEGSVLINGVPAAHLGDDISKVISVLNQSPHLFDTTVANNIRLGRQSATEEELGLAVQQAQLDGLIATLPAGLDTPMRETGQRFSGGERQRVALARILLQDAPVLVLDEPTVGLDPRTERELLSTIFRSTEGKTLVWVTHHLVGAEMMDEIVFMEHGEILMRGTHEELLAREPRYRSLYALDRPEDIGQICTVATIEDESC
ncbi:amino acid ABC transporter ATP-binding/permease protein [Paenibacillus woosongensis]|uniref:Amino acid ABC transporter ATP-binding/permease protein n=2 Tax=Paenibacillus woosongensis TaxID=307580 RepID=A0AA95KXX9_9BACL|nr:amino acid ABC transporter ATP-binding/permease protein [Paenibacillus woosongensis]WHX51595.1 amino acid ABC transporter ATP-binding/permease protein [Paenibacillus woosongensis]